jgi:hypothetical protein
VSKSLVPLRPAIGAILEQVGYAWDEERRIWQHPKTHRELLADVVVNMTPEQLADWVARGRDRPRLL